MKILVVEDEPNVASVINRGLSEKGYKVTVAMDGNDGLQLALNNEFDVILLDIMLPGMSGLFEIPLVVAISACFLLIEKMAIHLQDPFENKPTDTPMTHIATNIEKNLLQLYGLEAAKNKLIMKQEEEEDMVDSYYLSKKTYYVM